MKRSRIRTYVLAAALAAPVAVLACGEESQRMTHSGTLESVDASAKTLTIRHFGGDESITFSAEPVVLAGLVPDQSWVTVYYEEDGASLRAVEVVR